MGTITIDPSVETQRMKARFEADVLPMVGRGIGKKPGSKQAFPIGDDARGWWIGHYTRTFFFAEHAIGQDWKKARANVRSRAVMLGRLARALADAAGHSEIELRDAKVASMEVDCGFWLGARRGPIVPFFKWC